MSLRSRMGSPVLLFSLSILLSLAIAQQSPADTNSATHHKCSHGHDHHHHDDLLHKSNDQKKVGGPKLLPEELAEEEDLKLYGFGSEHLHAHDHEHNHHHPAGVTPELSGAGLWIRAMGCSLLVSMASLICLMIIPILLVKGKPSRAVVDLLAVFGAGAMLGDAFLHQLPHAFGSGQSHSHDHTHDDMSHGDAHSHSLEDLYVGLSVLSGIVTFLAVEKLVRYVEDVSGGAHSWGHGHSHHHHHHKSSKKLEDDIDVSKKKKTGKSSSGWETSDGLSDGELNGKQGGQTGPLLRKRNKEAKPRNEKSDPNAAIGNQGDKDKLPASQTSSLVFGYLNLISDGVHNFTDGMALGSAFLLYGPIGGWSRTLFLLAHELPQEIGDFGILVRSGFSVTQALFFNFLSALVALAGTALALLMGKNPGHSSVIEGFTAGGFIYIAIGGVLAEMNNNGGTGIKSIIAQLTSLTAGIGVAVCISLVE